jgi:hypothetical protein|tara:strand:- start:32 stop:565 length:534 start_codon:yes stop_codon:yes gene_type:complete
MFDFEEQLEIGKQGEKLIKLYYQSQTTEEGKSKFIVRDARKEEQLKGADMFVINNELGTRYIEVKTDTRAENTGNVALEIQIVYGDTDKRIGCALKTFPDFLMYWIYPTNRILYWNPEHLIPYITDWIINQEYRIVDAENKNFFSRSLIVPIKSVLETGVASEFTISYHLIDKIRAA